MTMYVYERANWERFSGAIIDVAEELSDCDDYRMQFWIRIQEFSV